MYLEQDRHIEALPYYEKAIDLARTEAELQLAISYVEATKMQIRYTLYYFVLFCNTKSNSIDLQWHTQVQRLN
jgi:hypothetical protein